MIKTFTDLTTWQAAHSLAVLIYKITKSFPDGEKYGLTSQMRRAAVSVSSNIAEGFGRTGNKDREHFYTMANGSIYEIKSQILLAKDLTFITDDEFKSVKTQINATHKLLNGLIKAQKSRS